MIDYKARLCYNNGVGKTDSNLNSEKRMLLQFRTISRLKNKTGFKLGYGYSSFSGNYGCVLTLIGVASLGVKQYNKLIENRSLGDRVPDLLAQATGMDQNKLRQLEAGYEGWTFERGYINTNHPQYKVGRRINKKFRQQSI